MHYIYTYTAMAIQTGFDFRWFRTLVLMFSCSMSSRTPWTNMHVLIVIIVSHYAGYVNTRTDFMLTWTYFWKRSANHLCLQRVQRYYCRCHVFRKTANTVRNVRIRIIH